MTDTKMKPQGYLEGLNERSTRADLWDRLKSLASKLTQQDEEQMTKLQEVMERVKAKRDAVATTDLEPIVILGTREEYEELVAFLGDFEDDDLTVLPLMLRRLLVGARFAAEGIPDEG